ncbi:MAG TPA: aldehyde dehydrogenase family protein, partial [Allocoleopsis sp.]
MLTQTLNIREIIQEQRLFFATNQTKNIDFRIQQLKTLKKIITDHETEIFNALKSDLNKAECEGFLSEVGVCLKEVDYAIKNLKKWAKPHQVNTSIILIPGQSKIYYEPLGVVLIIGAWNYPFYLMIAPLVGAIASGNCAILKPSELAVNTSHLLAELISKYFDKSLMTVIEGGKEINQELLKEKFDYIFFTGNAEVGKIVMSEAAKTLTPVTLELGGKSPCIVTENINLEMAAKRI